MPQGPGRRAPPPRRSPPPRRLPPAWPLPLLVVLGLVAGCGVPRERYDALRARTAKLEQSLAAKMKQYDLLETQTGLDLANATAGRAAAEHRATTLQGELARVRTALGARDQALAGCQRAKAPPAAPAPVLHVARRDTCRRFGLVVTLGKGLIQSGQPRAAEDGADPRSAALRAAVGAQLPALARCALMRHGRRKAPLAGALVATFILDPRGRAQRPRLAFRQGELRHVARCVTTALRGLRIAPAGAPAFVAIPLRFTRSKPFVPQHGCVPARAPRDRRKPRRGRRARRRAAPR